MSDLQEIQNQLADKDPVVRANAIEFLLQAGNPEAYGILMYTASSHFSPETRIEAKKASLSLKQTLFPNQPREEFSQTQKQALDLLKTDEIQTIRQGLKILMENPSAQVAQVLIRILHQEQRAEIQPLFILAAARIGGKSLCHHFLNFLRSNNEKVRGAVIHALCEQKDLEHLPIFLRFSRDPSPAVREECLKSLNSFPEKVLLSFLNSICNKDAFHSEACIIVIARLGISQGIDIIKKFTLSENLELAKKAKKALEYLTRQTQAPNPEPQNSSDSVKPKEIITPEKEMPIPVEDEEKSKLDEEEERHLRVIRQGEESSAISSVFSLMEIARLKNLGSVREHVIERNSKKLLATFLMAIGQSKDPGHQSFLIECLHHGDGRVQANAIEALRMLGITQAKQEVLPFVGSKNDRALANALIFLHPTGLVDTTKELSAMISSRSDNRKLSAIFVIMDLFDPKFVSLLDSALDSPNPKVSSRAKETLKMFILEDNEEAKKIAEKWGILKEISEQTLPVASPQEEEEKDSGPNMNDLLSNLNSPAKEDKGVASTQTIAKSEKPAAGINKLKTFVQGLFKKKES